MAGIHRNRKRAEDARRRQRLVLADHPETILIDRKADVKKGAGRDTQHDAMTQLRCGFLTRIP